MSRRTTTQVITRYFGCLQQTKYLFYKRKWYLINWGIPKMRPVIGICYWVATVLPDPSLLKARSFCKLKEFFMIEEVLIDLHGWANVSKNWTDYVSMLSKFHFFIFVPFLTLFCPSLIPDIRSPLTGSDSAALLHWSYQQTSWSNTNQ